MTVVIALVGMCSALFAQNSGQIAEQELKARENNLKSLSSSSVSNTNITYQRLELYVDPAVRYLTGKVTTVFIPDSAISFVEFDLSDTLTTDSIIYHGRTLQFTHTNNILHINLPANLPAALADSLAVFYQGVPDSSGFGSFVRSTHDSFPVIWTLSEPYGARDWWPCKQDLTDKIDSIDILITTPSAYKAASNGLLVEQTTTGANTVYHWKHRYPIAAYLVCMAVTNYRVYTDLVPFRGDTLSILNYVYPENYAADTIASKLTISVMQLYDSLLGMYPFSKEKYGQVEFNWTGGMEHQTMTFMHDYGFDLVAHELAHHWFGDKVTCDSWHDIWLNEGFAVFLTGVSYHNIAPYWYPYFKMASVSSGCAVPDGSVWCDDTTSIARIFSSHLSYYKGAVVLQQLNWMLGDSIFYAALRSYLSDTGNAYAFGTTASLQKHLEQISGTDLGNYFNQYVYGKGFPSFQVYWSQDFSHQVTLTLGQTQSDPSVAFFQIPVPIEFKNAVSDTIIIFNPTTSGQTYSFSLPFLADSILFDPNYEILSADNVITRRSTAAFTCLIYPNPAAGVLQFQLQTETSGNAEIRIYDMLGQPVYTGNTALQSGSNFLNIDITHLPAGVYELRAITDKQSITSAFVAGNAGIK